MNKRQLTSVLIGAAAFILFFFSYSDEKSTNTDTISASTDKPVVYINALTSAFFDETGKQSAEFTSLHAEQITGEKTLKLEKLHFVKYNNQDNWDIRSKTGKLHLHDQLFSLNDQVTIKNQIKAITIQTEQIHLDQKQNIAYTDDLVTIDSATSNTTSQGLELNINEEKLLLKKDVKTTIIPDQR